LGDRHRSPQDDRHFDAARREARGERVKGKEKAADPEPYNHVREIQGARNGVVTARDAITKELEHPPRDLTPYGRDLLRQQLEKAHTIIREVDQFLDSIGWPADRPFEWVRERGKWVPAADLAEMRTRVTKQLADVRKALESPETEGAIRETMRTNPSAAASLRTQRADLLQQVPRQQARVDAARTEADVNTARQDLEGLQRLWKALYEAMHLARVQ
jgi:hypothetical protein